jgi:hypothetical protein
LYVRHGDARSEKHQESGLVVALRRHVAPRGIGVMHGAAAGG